MDVTIIIVSWNTSALLAQCLNSVYENGSRFAFDVIVVDNGSTDDSVSMVEKRFPAVKLIRNEHNQGFARANNQALKLSKSRYVMLLNSDTIVLPAVIDTLIEIADHNPSVGVVGPKLLNMDGSLQKSWYSFPTILSELIGQNFRNRTSVPNLPNTYEVDWIMGACMLVRAEVLQNAGLLDEDYFFYSEEMDWCFRMKKQNWKIWYTTSTALYHLDGGSTRKGTVTHLVRLYTSKLLYFKKNHGNLARTLLRLGLALSNTLGVIRRLIFMNWFQRKAAFERIANQSKLVWCLLRDQYPDIR